MIQAVLSLLGGRKQGMSFSALARELRVSGADRRRLQAELEKLESQGVVLRLRKRYFLRPRPSVVRGRFTAMPRGFGFVIPEEEGQADVFVPARFAGGAHHGDVVEVHVRKAERGQKSEGRVVRILEKKKRRPLGICRVRSGQVFFTPFGDPSPQEVPVKHGGRPLPRDGDVISVARDTGRLEEVLGPLDAPGVDTRVVIERYDLADVFPEDVLREAEAVPVRLGPCREEGRVDHRKWTTMTIDGVDAQDFDDAVSIRREAGGRFRLGVHIADVSAYVRPGSALDREAYSRGTSIYFPGLTLPMLPPKLSNRVCSLRPGEDKLTVSVVLTLDGKGNVEETEFHPSLIRTAGRLTYDSVFKILQGDGEEREKTSPLVEDILALRDLARILRERRISMGSLDFDLSEPELVYKEGRLHAVEAWESNEAHQIIEECMLAANEAVAGFLIRKGVPLIFRIHPAPSREDLERLRLLLSHFRIELSPGKRIGSRDLQRVLNRVRGLPEEKFITLQVLKSLRVASYDPENRGHFGLAKKNYTHFTSPIRRYPDLVVHRILKETILGREPGAGDLAVISRHCSERERAAQDAERDLVEWRILRFLKEKLGEVFEGMIVDINPAGLIVELADYFVDGLVPYSEMGGDYFFRESEKVLAGRRTGKTYELGSRVKVVLVSVDLVLRRMSLKILEPSLGFSRRKRPGRKRA